MIDLRYGRYKEAYLAMAQRAKYRPGAPSGGFGDIQMSLEELHNPEILDQEADKYALLFLGEDKTMEYEIGCPDFAYNKAFFYTIEVARLLCGWPHGEKSAIQLLKMAIEEIEANRKGNGGN
jgi:hypothetical protein